MESKEYKLKFRYLYPFMGLMLYYILALMLFYLIEIKSGFTDLNLFFYPLLFLFLVEAILRFNAALKLEIPKLTFIVEFVVYFALLLIFSGRFQGLESIFNIAQLDLYLFFVISIIIWYQVLELTRLYEFFRTDAEKVFDDQKEGWNLDEFRRLLDYPNIWPKLTQSITWLNIVLFFFWAVMGELNTFFIALTILFLVIEVFLLAFSYLDKKKMDWKVAGIKESSSVKSGWHRFLLIFMVLALILAFMLPANYQPLPIDRIRNWLGTQNVITEMPEIEMGESTPENLPPAAERSEAEGEESPIIALIFGFLQLLIAAIFVLLILGFILFIVKSELGKISNLPQFFKQFYRFIKNSIKDILTAVKELNFQFKSSWQQKIKKKKNNKSARKEVKELKNMNLNDNSNSIISRIYYSLLKLLSLKGMGKSSDLTPYEYSSFLTDKYQNLKSEIDELTDIFVENAYSNHSLGESAVKTVKSIWKILKKKF